MTLVLACPFIAPPALAQDFNTGLVGHWKLDETSGGIIINSADVSSNNGSWDDGTNGDVTEETTTGYIGKALSFDGSDDLIDLGNSSTIDPSTLTVCAWARRDGNGNGNDWQQIVTNGLFQNYGWSLIMEPEATDIRFIVNRSGNRDMATFTVGDTSEWHHYCGSWDGTYARVYADGFLRDTSPATTMVDSTASITISEALDPMHGVIDDVRIYDRVLTEADIYTLYSTRLGSIRYHDESEAIQYYNDTNWVHAGTGSYAPNAVEFDGTNDYLVTPSSSFTDTKKGTISAWFKIDDTTISRDIVNNNDYSLRLNYNATNEYMQIKAENTGGGINLLMRTSNSSIVPGQWYHIIASWDLSDPTKRHIYLNDASDINVVTYVDELINYSSLNTAVGAEDGGSNLWHGGIADLWFDMNSYIDLSTEANRRKFISNNGMPMYLGPDGSLPLGQSPDIFLSGDTSDWHTNKGTAGGFIENGTLSEALGKPFLNTWRSATQTYINISASDAEAGDNFGGRTAFGPVDGIAVSENYVLVGANNENGTGAAYIFNRHSGAEMYKIYDPASNSGFGTSTAIDGNYGLVGSTGNCGGTISVYDLPTGTLLRTISPGLGNCLAWDLDASDGKVIAGTRTSTNAYVYDIKTGALLHTLSPATPNGGHTWGVSIDGDWAVVGNPGYNSNQGRAYLYDLPSCGASCTETYELVASDIGATDGFGYDVGIDGDYTVVSGDNAAYVFDTKTGTELHILTPGTADLGNGGFGQDIEVYNNLVIIGHDYGNTGDRYGAAELFDVTTGASVHEFLHPNPPGGSFPSTIVRFGAGTDIYKDTVVISVPGDDTIANDAGSAYIYTMQPCQSPNGHTGSIIYNSDDKVMQYCNGVDWVAMGPIGGTGGSGCADPVGAAGDIMYNDAFNVVQYCNSEDWVGIGYSQPFIPTAGLIHHWRLDETSGPTLYDSVGSADCTITGTINSVPGQLGTALEIEGGGGDCGDIADIKNLSAITISGWFRRMGPGDIAGAGKEFTDGAGMLGIYVWDDEYTYGAVGDNSSAVWEQAYGHDGDTLGMRHLTMVFDGTQTGNANRLKSFINGKQVTTSFTGTIPATTSTAARDFIIGNDAIIDDVRIYNRALSNREVEDLYLSTDTDACTGGGYEEGGSCWYMGALGQSCDNICAVHGLLYDPATLTYAGSSGTNTQCRDVLDAVYPYFDLGVMPTSTGCSNGVGCIVTTDPVRERCTSPATTSSDRFADTWRFCACQ